MCRSEVFYATAINHCEFISLLEVMQALE
jgi:hypothetical protein